MKQKGFINIIIIGVIVLITAAAGYFALTRKPAEAPAITQEPEVGDLPSEVLTKEGWKTYTNNILAVSIKYPPTWKVQEDTKSYLGGPVVDFFPPNPEPFTGYFSIGLDTRTFKDINEIREFYARLEKEPLARYKFTIEEIIIDNQKAYSVSRSDLSNSREFYLFRNDKIYILSTIKYDLREVREIISTLKFTGDF